MPRRIKRRSTRRKKIKRSSASRFSRSSRHKKRIRPSRSIIRNPSGVSDRLFVRLKYRSLVFLTSTLGAITEYVWRGNSLFDPDFTGTGGQPYMFDQWAAMYNFYVVHSSKINVKGINNTTSDYKLCPKITITPSTLSTTYSGPDVLYNQPYQKKALLPFSEALGSTGKRGLTNYMGTGKMYGIRPTAMNIAAEWGAVTTASPTSQWFWHVTAQTLDESSTSACIMECELTYYVEFSNRKRAAES